MVTYLANKVERVLEGCSTLAGLWAHHIAADDLPSTLAQRRAAQPKKGLIWLTRESGM